jgi:hypothetical protein
MIWGSIFGWPTAAARRLCRDWRVNDGLGADVLWHEIGMLAQALTRSLDLDDDGVMEETLTSNRGFAEWGS